MALYKYDGGQQGDVHTPFLVKYLHGASMRTGEAASFEKAGLPSDYSFRLRNLNTKKIRTHIRE